MGDEIAKSDLLLNELPEDVIVLDWGYEAEHPFMTRAARLARSGHPFVTCPGTNSWSTFTGLTDNMMGCIRHAAEAANTYYGEGMLLTDWGDMGHLQYLPVSYGPAVYAGALAWNPQKDMDREMLSKALDMFVFKDASRKMGRACLMAGDYAKMEEFLLPCRTLASTALSVGGGDKSAYENQVRTMIAINNHLLEPCVSGVYQESYDRRKPLNLPALMTGLEDVKKMFAQAQPQCAQGQLAVREYINGLEMVKVLSLVRALWLEDAAADRAQALLAKDLLNVIESHKDLWLERNKLYGLELGLAPLYQIYKKFN